MSSKKVKAVSFVLTAGILVCASSVSSKAAVISSNATDKLAAVFHEGTAYSAGDYVIYDGEMYICTEDIQGTWSQAETSFMQVTKNRELGRTEDLSAAYEESKDPSQETSLMAFAANAWQKLKGFLGINSRDAVPDASGYKNASLSEKLNYLEQQNQSHGRQLGDLQKSVADSFRYVSNGKSFIADAITDNKGTASPYDTFQQLSQAVRDMAQINYDKGAAFADGRINEKSESYKKGYDTGIAFADGRLNTSSVSYVEGVNAGRSESSFKTWSMDALLTYEGLDMEECPAELADCFHYSDEGDRKWWFNKDFGYDTKILAVYALATYTDPYGSSTYVHMAVKTDEDNREYHTLGSGDLCELILRNGTIRLGDILMNERFRNNSYSNLKLTVIYI